MTLQQGRNCFDGLKMTPPLSSHLIATPMLAALLLAILFDSLIEGSYIDCFFVVFFVKGYADFGNVSNVLTYYKNGFIDQNLIIKKKKQKKNKISFLWVYRWNKINFFFQ